MYTELIQFSSKETPNKQTKNQLKTGQGLPGGPVVKNQHSKAGDEFQSLVGEGRSHMPWGN